MADAIQLPVGVVQTSARKRDQNTTAPRSLLLVYLTTSLTSAHNRDETITFDYRHLSRRVPPCAR